MMIPFYATVIPQFLIVRFMPLFGGNNLFGQGGSGWIDTWWGLVVPGAISAFNIFLLRQFYVATPTELIEAARIDGVSEVGIWAKIITPLIKPGLLTVALLSFEQGWNNFLWPLLVTTSENLRVIQLGLSVSSGSLHRLPSAHGHHHHRCRAHDHPVRHLPEVLCQWFRQLRHQVRRS